MSQPSQYQELESTLLPIYPSQNYFLTIIFSSQFIRTTLKRLPHRASRTSAPCWNPQLLVHLYCHQCNDWGTWPSSQAKLLQEFSDIWNQMGSVSTNRYNAYHIHLWPSDGHALQVSSYTKRKIGINVEEMLEAQFIRPSTSLTSSPIVKRKYKWRFCSDYEELNRVT